MADSIRPSSGMPLWTEALTHPALGRRTASSDTATVPFWLFVVYESRHLPFFLKSGKPIFLPFLFPLRESKKLSSARSKFFRAFIRARESTSFMKACSALKCVTSGRCAIGRTSSEAALYSALNHDRHSLYSSLAQPNVCANSVLCAPSG